MAIGTDITKAFADRLSDLIEEKRKDGKTFKDIAAESGVPTGSLSKYQNDAGEPGINSLVKLAKYFDVSTDYMLGISDIASGNADDMAIEKRLGLNSKSISELSRFIDEEDGDSFFINKLSEAGFWKIIENIEYSYIKYTKAMMDEIVRFENTPEQRLLYSIEHANYQPKRNKDQLGFTLNLSAEHYFDFCLRQEGENIKWLVKEIADKFIDQVLGPDSLYEQQKNEQKKKKRKTQRAKREEGENG